MCCGAHGANEGEFSAKERVLMSKLRSTTSTFLTLVEGHSRPMYSVPVPINVRCYSDSDIIVQLQQRTKRANSRQYPL
jgi:hypothetical protein